MNRICQTPAYLLMMTQIERSIRRIMTRSYFKFVLMTVLAISQLALHVAFADSSTTRQTHNENSNQVLLAIPAKIEDPFWKLVQNGARDAAKIHGVDLQTFNYSAMSMSDELHALDLVISKPIESLILVKYYENNKFIESLRKHSHYAHFLQIINSGSSIFAKSDVLGNFTGMIDYHAGLAMGKALLEFSPRKILFITHLPLDNATTKSRLVGIQASMSVKADIQPVFIDSEEEVILQLKALDDNGQAIDTVVFLGPVSFQHFVKATKSMPNWQQKMLATFDLTKQIADYMLAGKIKVAIDQQPYLQGFYAVTNAALWNQYMIHSIGPIMTGPQTITPSIIPSIYNEIGRTR